MTASRLANKNNTTEHHKPTPPSINRTKASIIIPAVPVLGLLIPFPRRELYLMTSRIVLVGDTNNKQRGNAMTVFIQKCLLCTNAVEDTTIHEQLCTVCVDDAESIEEAYVRGFNACEKLIGIELEEVLKKLVQAKVQYDLEYVRTLNRGSVHDRKFPSGQWHGMNHAVEILHEYVYGVLKA
jgi:hypothetical protein